MSGGTSQRPFASQGVGGDDDDDDDDEKSGTPGKHEKSYL